MKKSVKWFLGLSTLITFGLYVVPFGSTISYPLLMLSTLVHEMGHGLTALAVGGRFDSFQMWSNGSGVAQIGGFSNRFASALVSAGGLLGPACAAALGFILSRKETLARLTFSVLGAFLIVSEFLWVRNSFGWIFIGVLSAIYLWLAQQRSGWLAQAALIFFSLQLSLSVFSRADYLFTPIAHTAEGNMPSDVAQIAQALWLPYWFWGGICAAFSGLVLLLGLRVALK
ncbi:MAG: M50 family metallopeptidase [Myxococcaceae bacterium]